VSRYRRWNEPLELLAAAGQLQVEDAAEDASRPLDAGVDVVIA
jgi:hypothetical protein